MVRLVVACVLGVCGAFTPAWAQRSSASSGAAFSLALDTLLATAGPQWATAISEHFRVYVERSATSASYAVAMVDSLERAWNNAVDLLAIRPADTSPITVLVTASRTRFSRILPADAKGVSTTIPALGDLIILVHNDSVRPYARHEVMHVVARRVWGHGSPFTGWVNEGLATYADGRCQTSTIMAVGRDILRQWPEVTVAEVADPARRLFERDRAEAYVLSATLVAYVFETEGRDSLRALWRAKDPPAVARLLTGGVVGDDPTPRWRAWVIQRAGREIGLDSAAFRRAECG